MSPGVDQEAAEGEAGVQLDVLGAHHARVLHGAFGGRQGSGPGSCSIDQLATLASTSACTSDGGRPRTSSWAVASSFQPSPRASAWTSRERWTQNQAARSGSPSSSSEVQRPLGDLQGAFALPAEPARDGGLGHQVEVAQRGGGRVAAAGRVDLGVVDGAQRGAYVVGGGVPQLHRPFQQPQLLGVGVPAAGLDGGVEDGGQGLGRVVGVVPVAGQPDGALVGGDERRVGLQGFGVAAVEAGALAGQQVVADGLADQGVAEAVAVAVRVRRAGCWRRRRPAAPR